MPTTNFSPVVIGGNLGVAGNVGTGPIQQGQHGVATGASVSLSIPMMPLQLMNLDPNGKMEASDGAFRATPFSFPMPIKLQAEQPPFALLLI